MKDAVAEPGYLPGQLLIAMPSMSDPRFERAVIYLCAHSSEGAMGLVVNKLIDSLTFPELLEQLDIKPEKQAGDIRVHFGGPVESGRGFVLHSDEYLQDSSMVIDEGVALTATLDVLRDVADGSGPRQSIMALGYAGWGPGQLDAEIIHNGWLHAPADTDLLFSRDIEKKWDRAIHKIGVDPFMLTTDAGHA
ncbi:YqgE/AlgH family protein [Alphaproteobacteria bacterium HT1-32]|nr:YqgE/AlgH family protein [Alphaproteobacteria bacterium HT1-32]|tara:strand:- start:54000 stop:54575 length:576 start_codon:yes stop_codon:yes gene_type:complete